MVRIFFCRRNGKRFGGENKYNVLENYEERSGRGRLGLFGGGLNIMLISLIFFLVVNWELSNIFELRRK